MAGDSEKVATTVAIGLAESGGNADAIGDVSLEDSTWGPSVGWYQVRSLWAQDGTGGERDRTKLTDPAFNSLSMCSISRGGTYWAPWSTYTNGAYASHLTEARQAAATAMGVDVSAANASTATSAAADQGCTAPGGRSLGAIADRLWCNAIVRPWLALGTKPNNQSWWSKLDGWIFGAPSAPKAAKGQPSSYSTATVANSDGMQPSFVQQLGRMFAAAPGTVAIGSDPGMGFRTVAQQQSIIDAHGGECGVWVACIHDGTCGSMHCKGLAADLAFDNDSTKAWVHAHAADYGLTFPMDYEDWHIEPVGARGGTA